MNANTTTSGTFSSAPSQSNTTSSQSAFSSTTHTDTQVTSFVRQLDAQGPAVVQRITTHVGSLACSDDLVRNLVEALHEGKSVTLTSDVNGQTKTATFNATGTKLGYGEAYIAIALAAEQLRNAGVTGCATPEQWQAVLLGGPLNTSVSSTTSSTASSSSGATRVPGIVTLHRQGQGWGQIAKTTNVQLGQVLRSSNASASTSTSSSADTSSPSPTGFSSAEMNKSRSSADDDDDSKSKGKKKGWERSKDDQQDALKDQKASDPDKDSAKPGERESSDAKPDHR